MRPLFTTLVLGVIGGVALLAQDAQSPQQTLTPKEIKWPAAATTVGTAGVAGLQIVVLKGDPKKPGLYTLLLRLPPNTKILAHSHKDDRTAVVLSGDWYFGYGREFDEAALKEMPAGSFYTEPPGVEHFGQTKDQETIIEITGYGPTSTTYVDPKKRPDEKVGLQLYSSPLRFVYDLAADNCRDLIRFTPPAVALVSPRVKIAERSTKSVLADVASRPECSSRDCHRDPSP